ncbi:hypothetical protein [Streptomyces sp. OE57]|uniref:baeRF2 domain-containing protein n=1 Tax=Streptomyces lacaronensis TaxID=3379885 RepID=UPI0039B78B74
MVNRLPAPLRNRVAAVPGNGQDVESGRALLEPELAAPFRGRRSARDRDRLESFAAQRARNPLSEGLVEHQPVGAVGTVGAAEPGVRGDGRLLAR